MVLLCRGSEVLPHTSTRVTPAEKDCRKSEHRGNYELVTFILVMYADGYLNEVEQFVREINGAESVKGYSNRLEVTGKVDPRRIRKKVKRHTKAKVTLSFQLADIDPEEKSKQDNTRSDDVSNEINQEGVIILKIKLCCDTHNQKLQKILKIKGLEMEKMDMEKDLVTVKGTVDKEELRSYIKRVLKKDVEVLNPVKKDTIATKNEDRDTGANAINKKGKDAGDATAAADKSGKQVGSPDMITSVKETGRTHKKIESKGRVSVPEGIAIVENKNEKKETSVNKKKDKEGGGRQKSEEASSDGSSSGKNQERDMGLTLKANPLYYHHRFDVNHTSDFHQLFSDENPNSCTVL